MTLRLVLASSCALAMGALALAAACGGGQRLPAGVASAGDGGVRDASREAAAPPLFGGACPEDAPWTGTVCLGQGYVACPGGYSMDDRSRCVRDVAAGGPATVGSASSADADEEPAEDTD